MATPLYRLPFANLHPGESRQRRAGLKIAQVIFYRRTLQQLLDK